MCDSVGREKPSKAYVLPVLRKKYKVNVTFLILIKGKPSIFHMVTQCQAKLLKYFQL